MTPLTTIPNIFTVLRYADAPTAIDFLNRAFGLQTREVFTAPDGTVAHAELDLGSDVIGLSSAGPIDSAKPWTTARNGVYACVPEIDQHYAQAVSAGADVFRPLQDTGYGSREYSARDPEGHLWSFGTYGMGATAGASRVYPGLHYRDASAAAAWLTRAFGFDVLCEVPDARGRVHHAELTLPPGVVMLESGPRDPAFWGDRDFYVAVSVDDPDAHASRAAAQGAVIVQPPADTPYGARAYYATDMEGAVWGFSTYVPSRTAEAARHGARQER